MTTTSTSAKSCFASVRVQESFWTRWVAWWWSRFIFQLPAISGVRVVIGCLSAQNVNTGEDFPFEVLQGGAATGGDVPEGVFVKTEESHRSCGVPAADDGESAAPGGIDEALRDRFGSLREGGKLEHAHRAVPHDRVSGGDGFPEGLRRIRADVEADLVGGHLRGRDGGGGRIGRELWCDEDVGRQDDLHPFALRGFQVALDRVELVLLEQRVPHFVPLRGEEGEHHSSADAQRVRLAEEVLDDAEFVGDFRTAEDDDVRASRVGGGPGERSDLLFHEFARGAGEEFGDVVDGGLLAVHDPEPIRDENVG